MSILIIFPVILVLLFPIAALVFLVMSIGEYKNAADGEDKEQLKKRVRIATVVTVIAFIILAALIAVYVYLLLALANMT